MRALYLQNTSPINSKVTNKVEFVPVGIHLKTKHWHANVRKTTYKHLKTKEILIAQTMRISVLE